MRVSGSALFRGRRTTGTVCFERAMPVKAERDLRALHKQSSHHRATVLASSVCRCFHCCARFAPSEIRRWVDSDPKGLGATALCPKCGVDSVLGDACGAELSDELVRAMRARWFG